MRFALALQEGRLLRPETVALLQAPQRLSSGQETGYGLGWKVQTIELAGDRTRAVGHDGDVLGGRVASLLSFPRHGLVVSVVSNISYADTSGLAVRIAQAFAPAIGAAAAVRSSWLRGCGSPFVPGAPDGPRGDLTTDPAGPAAGHAARRLQPARLARRRMAP